LLGFEPLIKSIFTWDLNPGPFKYNAFLDTFVPYLG